MTETALKPDQKPIATTGITELEVVSRDLGIDVTEEELIPGVVEFFSNRISAVVDSITVPEEYHELYGEIWDLFGLNGTRVSQKVGDVLDGLTGLWEVEDEPTKKAEVKRLLSELAEEVIQTSEAALMVLDKYADIEYEEQS